jgi:hypothetical protein
MMFGLLFFWLFACNPEPYPRPIPGTAYRIGKPEPDERSEITVALFEDWVACANAGIDDVVGCQPYADRSSGEMKISFELRDPTSGTRLMRSLKEDEVTVLHDKARQDDVQLIPHDASRAGQLYILLVDTTPSMFYDDGAKIKKVYQALLTKQVIDAFYPADGDGRTGVVLLRFGDKVVGVDGGPPRVLKNVDAYKAAVKEHLMTPIPSWTFLYEAIKFSVTDLLKQKQIEEFMALKSAQPTVVLLTDGFHNEGPQDTCATNVPRLQATVDLLKNLRRDSTAQFLPTLYTAGIGQAYQNLQKPEGLNNVVTEQNLCGEYGNNQIHEGLEKTGIDHISLQWLAETGGGQSFIKRKATGLAEVLTLAAAERYGWYELRYRVPDPFWHRQTFDLTVGLSAKGRATSTLPVYPNAWLDAPPGLRENGERWARPNTMRATAALTMPILGVLVFLNFLGAATFNTRRALFRRAKAKR